MRGTIMAQDEGRSRSGQPVTASDERSTEWFMPFIPGDEGAGGPTDEAFGGRGGGDGAGFAARDRQVSGPVVFIGRLLMLGALVVFLAAVAIGITGGGVTERATTTQEFALPANATISLANTAGSVRISAGATDRIVVQTDIEVRHFSHALARQALTEGAPRITQTNGVVTIAPSVQPDWSFFLQHTANVSVLVPANATLTLDQRAGTMSVSGVSGKIVATVSAGTLNLDDVQLGNGSDLRVRAGSIRFDGELLPAAAVNVEVVAGNASLFLPVKTDARLDASAVTGNITVTGWPTTVTTNSTVGRKNTPNSTATGTLSSDPNPTGLLTIRVNTGSAELTARGGTPLRLPTGPTAPAAPVPSLPPVPPVPGR